MMTATETRLQEIKRKKVRIRDTILSALRGTVLYFEVWKCGDQLEMPEARTNKILNDWLENEGGDGAVDHLVNLIIRGTNMTDKDSLAEERYKARYMIEKAIVDAISKIPSHPTFGVAKDNFRTWCEDEEGDLVLDRLVNLIIY